MNEAVEAKQPETKPFLERVERFAGSALYGLIVALAGVVSGIVAALRPDVIKNSWPPSLYGTPNAATLFWLALAIWVPMYFLREYVKGKEVMRLQQSSSDIKNAVQTLPPVDFVNEFAAMTSQSHMALMTLLPRGRAGGVPKDKLRTEIEKVTRAILENLRTLARTYDQRAVLYGVNVMVFVKRAEGEPYFSGFKKDELDRYLPPGFDHRNLDGVLRLQREFSVQGVFTPENSPKSGQPAEGTPDRQIVFGIPAADFLKDEKLRWRVLPGAPMTFVRWNEGTHNNVANGVHYMHDFQRLEKEMKDGQGQELYLDADVLKHLAEDYSPSGPEKYVRSFLSFPLVGEDRKALGTLNIHCSEPSVLGVSTDARIVNFVGVVLPMVNEVSSLLKAWQEAGT